MSRADSHDVGGDGAEAGPSTGCMSNVNGEEDTDDDDFSLMAMMVDLRTVTGSADFLLRRDQSDPYRHVHDNCNKCNHRRGSG